MLVQSHHSHSIVVPILTYAVLPYFPPALLCVSNDDYVAKRHQFDMLLASSLSTATDGVPFPDPSADYYPILNGSYDDAMHSLLVLLISKRLALYALATMSTVYAGWRAYATGVHSMRCGIYGGPGDALDGLNREVLSGERRQLLLRRRLRLRRRPAAPIDAEDAMGIIDEVDIDGDDGGEEGSGPFASLVDDGPASSEDAGTFLALSLPLVLGATLALSYIMSGGHGPIDVSSTGVGIVDMIGDKLARLGPILSTLPGAMICLLFLATEFRWAVPDDIVHDTPSAMTNAMTTTNATTAETTNTDIARRHPILCAGNAVALAYVIGAYLAKVHPTIDIGPARLDLWPLQNGANIALAATVARALTPFLLATTTTTTSSSSPISPPPMLSSPTSSSGKKSIRTVALAMFGLAIFDAVATFGTVANAATSVVDVPSASMSVMEAVARSKLASWQPGLLEVIVGHDNPVVTEALGLGDVVFPSILVAWGLAADDDIGDVEPTTMVCIDDELRSVGEEIDDSGDNKSIWGHHHHPYASASVLGYLFGSFVTEIVGSFALLGNRSGLPALVFLIPSMLGAVTLMAWSRNELCDVWGDANRGNLEDDEH